MVCRYISAFQHMGINRVFADRCLLYRAFPGAVMGDYKFDELLKIMWFCLARFFVFSFQYYLVIHLLIPEIPLVEVLLMVFIVFFIQSALPSLDLLDIAVRSAAATTIFAYVTHQQVAVIAAFTSIWLINLIIPAILGSVFILKLNFFDRS